MSSFLTAHQHILGYLVPYNDVEDTVKESFEQPRGNGGKRLRNSEHSKSASSNDQSTIRKSRVEGYENLRRFH